MVNDDTTVGIRCLVSSVSQLANLGRCDHHTLVVYTHPTLLDDA